MRGFSFAGSIPVTAHLWVYASAYPPNWDCTPILDKVFADLTYAGLSGVELMDINLRHPDAVAILKKLIFNFNLPVTGTSYSANMWNKPEHQQILEDVKLVASRLQAVGGKTFGISVGDARHQKTEGELDAQAEILLKTLAICKEHGIEANLHNHTYEVKDHLHDLKGTLSRVPQVKLGPDINWLIRAGVDPVSFIETYGDRIVYLHIRDQDQAGTWTETVGSGVTDFDAIANALKKIKFQGMAAIELAFPNDFVASRPLKEDWKVSREYVRRTFGW